MARARLKLAPDSAWTRIRTAPQVDEAVLEMAMKVCEAANRWADAQPRSGKHAVERPHFEVHREASKRRSRYTVRPATGYATWLVVHDPSGFQACLDAGRR